MTGSSTVKLAVAVMVATLASGAEVAPPVRQAVNRMYNFDFAGANQLLDSRIAAKPDDSVAYSFRAASLLFQELDRLRILEGEFFTDDKRIIEKKGLKPDADVRRKFYDYIETGKHRAQQKLETNPADIEGLFTMSISAGLVTDYMALVEKRQFASLSSARDAQTYAVRLLKIDPAFTDAYLATGVTEYLLGSLPFFVRWVLRFDEAEGDKSVAVSRLNKVAATGQCLGPFAKILLSIIHLREKQPHAAERRLAELARDYPQNQLIQKELTKVRTLIGTSSAN